MKGREGGPLIRTNIPDMDLPLARRTHRLDRWMTKTTALRERATGVFHNWSEVKLQPSGKRVDRRVLRSQRKQRYRCIKAQDKQHTNAPCLDFDKSNQSRCFLRKDTLQRTPCLRA